MFMQGVFFIAACTSVLAVALICVFLFANGIPAMKEIGFMEFLTGERWKPTNEIFGILPMIMGSIYVTAGAIILGVPIGILTSVFMAKYCPKKIYPVLKGATELLGRNPVRCIWIFWIGSTCAIDQRHLPEISLGWKWKQHSDCIYLTWNDDSSDDHRCHRVSDPFCAGALL